MKKILGMAVVAALTAGVSVFAANPFSDVSTSDWAYQAVSDLSSQGIVEGYPDGTFKGQSNITRYEMAQIVARLMAKEDQYNAEQRATIDKLAGEYADELDSLGVRVGSLEKKVGNISWSGDARLRYQGFENDSKDDIYRARMRVNVKGKVNDQVTVIGRFTSEADLNGGKKNGETTMDRIHVLYQPTDTFSLDLGRTDLFLGQTGYLYDDRFAGVKADYNTDKFGLEVGYGREWKMGPAADYIGNGESAETFYVQANGKIADGIRLNAFYQNFAKGDNAYTEDNMSLWGVGARIDLGNSGFFFDGDYIQNTASGKIGDVLDEDGKATASRSSIDKPVLWVAGLNYGNVSTKKPGSYQIGVHYINAEQGSYVGSTTLDMDYALAKSWDNGAKFWNAKASVALMKGVELDAYYYFAGEDKDGNDIDDTYGVELNYKF